MPASPIANYLNTLRRDLRAGDATERSHYPTLKALIESLAPGTTATVEPKWSDWGAPDFHVKNRAGLIIGHIEAKDVGKSLDDAERSEQLKDRYLKSVENLILTNFVEFRWYVRGREPGNARLGRFEAPAAIHALPADREGTLALLNSFFAHSPQGADDAKDLAVRLARYTHEIRNVVLAGFVHGDISDNVRALRDILKQDLVPDLTDEAFADMFAQTLTYGMFAAWCNHPDNTPFQRLGAAADIPKTNPLLRRVFELNTLSDMDDEPHAVYVDSVVQLLRLTDRAAILEDFARRTGREDPVVHFYETFLKEYDPKLRELRGVYYTPPAVISYMVRSVDHLLKTRFGIPNGLADTARTDFVRVYDHDRKEQASAPRVLILDPACGTGTFLYEIVNHIRDGFIRKRQAGAWRSYVREQLLPRLFGFELLMAPYAVAHLKLGLQLAAKLTMPTTSPRVIASASTSPTPSRRQDVALTSCSTPTRSSPMRRTRPWTSSAICPSWLLSAIRHTQLTRRTAAPGLPIWSEMPITRQARPGSAIPSSYWMITSSSYASPSGEWRRPGLASSR
jgi:hypothetical protein